MADTRRALDDFVNATTGIFRDAQNCNAQDMRDFIVSVYGTGGLFLGATKTADFTAEVGELYPVDANNGGTGLSDNIDVTFPSTPSAGDTFGYFVNTQNVTDTGSSGFAKAPFWGVDPVNATIINNESYTNAAGDGTEKWGLFINSELLIFRYVDATVGWQVIEDATHQAIVGLKMSATITTNSAATWKDLDLDTLTTLDKHGMHNATDGHAEIKRAGDYFLTAQASTLNNVAADNYYGVAIGSASATKDYAKAQLMSPVSTPLIQPVVFNERTLNKGTDVFAMFIAQQSNRGADDVGGAGEVLSVLNCQELR